MQQLDLLNPEMKLVGLEQDSDPKLHLKLN